MGTGQDAPRHSSQAALILTVLLLGGSAVGMAVYQMLQDGKTSSVLDPSGFDIAATAEEAVPATAAQPATRAQAGLDIAAAPRMGGLRFQDPGLGAGARQAPSAPKAAAGFAEAVWNNEKQIRNLAIAYTRKHPDIAAYGREWMSHPDLKKLNDDYMRDRDPIKFMRGVAGSRNFYNLVKKYAGSAPIRGFVQEAMVQAPSESVSSAMQYMEQDGAVKKLVTNVTSSMGLPPALLPGVRNGGGAIDEKKTIGRIIEQADGPRF